MQEPGAGAERQSARAATPDSGRPPPVQQEPTHDVPVYPEHDGEPGPHGGEEEVAREPDALQKTDVLFDETRPAG